MEQKNIYSLSKKIEDKGDFQIFMKEFIESLSKESETWGNNTLESFLEGFYGYVCDVDKDINWKDLSEILLASRVYE